MHKNKGKQNESLANLIATGVGTPLSIGIHTLLFAGIFLLSFFGLSLDKIMLILTTAVSLEAIYLSLFIQMTVNKHAENLEDVEEDIDEIHENVEEISEDIDDVAEDVEGIESDIKAIQEDVEDVGEDVDDISKKTNRNRQTEKTLYEHPDHAISVLMQKISTDMATLQKELNEMKMELKKIQNKA